MGAEIKVGFNANEELYGPGAITGSLDDIEVSLGPGGNHVQVKTGEGAVDGQVDSTVKPDTNSPDGGADATAQEAGKAVTDGTGEGEDKDPGVAKAELKGSIEDMGKDLKGKGFDFESALSELETNGALSEATYAKLADAGYPKTVIDGFIQAASIVERDFENAVYGLVGSKEEYNTVIQWAFNNASKKEQSAYDAALDRGDLATAKLYMDNFKARMGKVFGTGNGGPTGAPVVAATVEGFETKKDLTKATSDPRYGRDAKYTNEVQARLLKTNWL